MRNAVAVMLSLAALATCAQHPWTPATEGWVSQKVAQAEARTTSNTAAQVSAAVAQINATTLKPADTNGWTVSSHAGFLTAEQDLASLAALADYAATSRVTRIAEGSNAWYTFAASTITRYETNPAIITNVTFSSDFETTTHETLYPQTLAWPLSGYGWSSGLMDYGGDTVYFISHNSGAYWFGSTEPGNLYPYVDAVGVASMHVFSVVTTNIVDYDLLSPPETWSSTDQTNWMEFGNAGQLWVTDLAFDAANVLVNGHLAATDPHPGKYVKLTGGAATNLALVNASVGGDTVIGAVAVSNAANVIVNGHLAATDPHAGRYVKLTGGAATNLTVVGTVAMPGVVTFSNGVTLAVGVALNGTNCWRMTDPTGLTNAYYPLPW